MARVKQVLLYLVIAFVAYAILTSPNQSADLVRSSGTILSDGVQNIFGFFDAILKK